MARVRPGISRVLQGRRGDRSSSVPGRPSSAVRNKSNTKRSCRRRTGPRRRLVAPAGPAPVTGRFQRRRGELTQALLVRLARVREGEGVEEHDVRRLVHPAAAGADQGGEGRGGRRGARRGDHGGVDALHAVGVGYAEDRALAHPRVGVEQVLQRAPVRVACASPACRPGVAGPLRGRRSVTRKSVSSSTGVSASSATTYCGGASGRPGCPPESRPAASLGFPTSFADKQVGLWTPTARSLLGAVVCSAPREVPALARRGSGGMGTVYLAAQEGPGGHMAVKNHQGRVRAGGRLPTPVHPRGDGGSRSSAPSSSPAPTPTASPAPEPEQRNPPRPAEHECCRS